MTAMAHGKKDRKMNKTWDLELRLLKAEFVRYRESSSLHHSSQGVVVGLFF
jgi:hypothetical protein